METFNLHTRKYVVVLILSQLMTDTSLTEDLGTLLHRDDQKNILVQSLKPLCTPDSNLRLHLIVEGVDCISQQKVSYTSCKLVLFTVMGKGKPSNHHEVSQFMSMIHDLVNLGVDYQNRALMKYLQIMSLDGNRETSQLTDGEFYKYHKQNCEMLKVKGGKVYQHNKINSQGSYINTSNTICVISCADMSLTWAFHIFCTSQYR